ncbi:Na+/H+ antiporter subunit E [soil metagenome]
MSESRPSTPDGARSVQRTSPPVTTMLAWNLVLALAWVAMSGQFSAENLAVGFAFGYLALFLLQRATGPSPYFTKAIRLAAFLAFYLVELVRANLRVAYDVITPSHHMHPGIVAIPLEARSNVEITLLANLITMTPGSLSLDVSDDRSTLYVHSMFMSDPEAFRDTIKREFERRVLELLR